MTTTNEIRLENHDDSAIISILCESTGGTDPHRTFAVTIAALPGTGSLALKMSATLTLMRETWGNDTSHWADDALCAFLEGLDTFDRREVIAAIERSAKTGNSVDVSVSPLCGAGVDVEMDDGDGKRARNGVVLAAVLSPYGWQHVVKFDDGITSTISFRA